MAKNKIADIHNKSTKIRHLPEYRNWHNMKNRCVNPNVPEYKYYGARGIKVCERWIHSFRNFYEDMGPRPSPKHSIDRINNDGDYSPENCRWATQTEQSRNTRCNHLLTINGISKTISEWAEMVGIKQNSLLYRIRRGISPEDAINPTLERKSTKAKRDRAKTCVVCNGYFIPRPSQIRSGQGKYCSQKCNFASREKDSLGRVC